jgi:hypothetical protein
MAESTFAETFVPRKIADYVAAFLPTVAHVPTAVMEGYETKLSTVLWGNLGCCTIVFKAKYKYISVFVSKCGTMVQDKWNESHVAVVVARTSETANLGDTIRHLTGDDTEIEDERSMIYVIGSNELPPSLVPISTATTDVYELYVPRDMALALKKITTGVTDELPATRVNAVRAMFIHEQGLADVGTRALLEVEPVAHLLAMPNADMHQFMCDNVVSKIPLYK